MTPEQMRTAIDARQDLDVLHALNEQPAGREEGREPDDDAGQEGPAQRRRPAFSAALLLLRLELSGAQL